eukprot:Hpha_TRINITY_DN25681_c0_g1::TRINITY_DN25681_c0_g1_i1::g.47335::m.47335
MDMMMGMMGGGQMISAEETKRLLRQGIMPGAAPPPPQNPAATAGGAESVAEQAAAMATGAKEPRALSEERTEYFRLSAALTFLDLREAMGEEGIAKERNHRRTGGAGEEIGAGERVRNLPAKLPRFDRTP